MLVMIIFIVVGVIVIFCIVGIFKENVFVFIVEQN